MKLFYKPGACSLASHITLIEQGLDHEIEQVDTDAATTENNQDYLAINPKGYVPTLQLDSGENLTESVSVLQYLGDLGKNIYAPANGTIDKARLQEYLSYTAAELHKAFGPFFSNTASEADKEKAGKTVAEKFDYLETIFADGRDYLLGENFSVADTYLFVVTNWANFVDIPLANWPKLNDYVLRVFNRDATQKAMKAEGLIS
jgi:glutathione S-transferase